MDKNIATLLREIKATSGMSEPQIAVQLKISQPTVNRILNGQGDCKGKTLRAIEELYATVCGPEANVARRATDPEPPEGHPPRILPSNKNILGFGLDQSSNFKGVK